MSTAIDGGGIDYTIEICNKKLCQSELSPIQNNRWQNKRRRTTDLVHQVFLGFTTKGAVEFMVSIGKNWNTKVIASKIFDYTRALHLQ